MKAARQMNAFTEFERAVVRLLRAGRMNADEFAAVLDGAEGLSREHSGVGHFPTVRHLARSKERGIHGTPLLAGRCGRVAGGFAIFPEKGEPTLECHFRDGSPIADDIRERQLRIESAA